MKPQLTLENLIQSAKSFCESESKRNHTALIGVTDGKAVGTYVEHQFRDYLRALLFYSRKQCERN